VSDFTVVQTVIKNFARNHETRVGYTLGESREKSRRRNFQPTAIVTGKLEKLFVIHGAAFHARNEVLAGETSEW